MDGFVLIAEVVKAVGLKGEVKLYPLLDFDEGLLSWPGLVWGDGTEAPVIGHRPAGNCVAIRVRGCHSRNDAEALVGREVGFLRDDYLQEDFPRPPGGLAFRYVGRNVVTAGGEPVGRVDEVRRAGGQILLVIQRDGGEILIPALEPILRRDEGLVGDLVVDPPEGLFDVNSA